MEFLQNLLDNSQVPVFTAFLLGLLTALSPCPLATNITAIAFISRKGVAAQEKVSTVRRNVFLCGLFYAIGRCLAYTALGAALIYIIRRGSDTFELQQVVSEWGELILGPALIVIGALMLMVEFFNFGGRWGFNGGDWAERLSGPVGSFVIGILFAMAFCPSSGLLYFGMLIPLSATAEAGYLLPLVYAVATALPVLLVAWVLAYSVQSLSNLMGKITVFQKWFNRVVALLFVAVGLYYCYIFFIS